MAMARTHRNSGLPVLQWSPGRIVDPHDGRWQTPERTGLLRNLIHRLEVMSEAQLRMVADLMRRIEKRAG